MIKKLAKKRKNEKSKTSSKEKGKRKISFDANKMKAFSKAFRGEK